MEYLSTSSIANNLKLPINEVFNKMKNLGWIYRNGENWMLTELGKKLGGQMKSSAKYGEYIVWPEDLTIENSGANDTNKLINATVIGKHFNVSPQRLNLILAEIGFIEKTISGWSVTRLGKAIGGKQCEFESSGGSYVLWPTSILENTNITGIFSETSIATSKSSDIINVVNTSLNDYNTDNFREKFPAAIRTKDGHNVRSKSEVIIDNALYDYNLAHAYERKLPIEETVYCDFFVPKENVYIEFWGLENDPKYLDRKNYKIGIYKKYAFKLIELTEKDVQNLDDHLPKKLLKFGIKIF